ncbi:MAG: hypothetical protein A3G82_00380 [Burkholderiales bacterium RIFCSPLOWO2_12_FULL_67_210]|nr:MAG: hypothetical protein A3G82_00380 [Burkholderiales bacterium RIFCSPLOWO2_12_FULL_67_210]
MGASLHANDRRRAMPSLDHDLLQRPVQVLYADQGQGGNAQQQRQHGPEAPRQPLPQTALRKEVHG